MLFVSQIPGNDEQEEQSSLSLRIYVKTMRLILFKILYMYILTTAPGGAAIYSPRNYVCFYTKCGQIFTILVH